VSEINVEPADDESRRLWSSVGDLVALLPADWVLIGGLMVQLHAFELGVVDVRATKDVDVLGQVRPQGTLAAIDAALQREGFTDVRRIWTATPAATNVTGSSSTSWRRTA
jgi:hypothetical protein